MCVRMRGCFNPSVMWLIKFNSIRSKKIGSEVFGELRNKVLEENGEDKMVMENN